MSDLRVQSGQGPNSGTVPVTELATISDVPALIRRERGELAGIADPTEVLEAERRAAAIAELTRRAGLAIPVQNEATLYRAEALERLAVVVGEAQKAGEIATSRDGAAIRDLPRMSGEIIQPELDGSLPRPPPKTLSQLGIDDRRIAEGRALAETDVLERARASAIQRPNNPLRFADLVERAKRLRRIKEIAEKRGRLEHEARIKRVRLEALGQRPFLLEEGDIRHWRPNGRIGDPLIDAIITDPPYVTPDALELYSALADFALDVLKPGGVLAAMVWQPMLVDVIDALRRDDLAYRWAIVWRFSAHNNTGDQRRRVYDMTKLVLVYHRSAMPVDAPYFTDIIEADDAGKDLHAWQQSLTGFEWLVERLSWPGETVCDPFTGSGTTAVAALRTERLFVGCDIDPAAIETAMRRLEP